MTGPGGSNTQTRTNYVTVGTPALAQFTGTPTKGKAPQTVAFTNSSTGSITSYAWTFGDGTTSPVANPSKIYSASGVYTVALTVTGPGGSHTKTQTNYVKVTPRAKFSASSTSRDGSAHRQFHRRITRRRHQLRLGLRRRHDQHRRQSEQGLFGAWPIHGHADGDRGRGQRHPDHHRLRYGRRRHWMSACTGRRRA